MDLADLVDGPFPDVLLAPLQVELRTDADEADALPLQVDDGETDVDMAPSSSSRASALSMSCSVSDSEASCISEPCALPVVEVMSRQRVRWAKIATAKFFGNKAPIQVQAQVVLVNAVDMAMRIPKALLSQAFRYLSATKAPGKLAYAFIAKLAGLGPKRLSKLFRRVRDNGWEPCPEKCGENHDERCISEHQQSVENAVRMSLANIVEGSSGLQYERDIARLGLSGCAVHWRCRSRHFVRDVEHLAGRIIQSLDAADINTPLRALGIPSDFGILIDPVSIGSSFWARHDTVLMECLSVISPHTHRIHTPMFGGATLPIGGHTGDTLSELTQEVLAEHPAGLNLSALRARCSVVGGDGQVVLGGPAHRHNSSKAAEKLWLHLFPEADTVCTSWDYFHRADNACMRGIRAVSAAQEVFDLAAAIDTLFGIGEGRLMMRGVGALIDQPQRSVANPGGTRKVVYLSGVPGNLLKNYTSYFAGFHARIAWTQAGHSTQSLKHLVSIGRRFTDVSFVTTLLLLHDILKRHIQPYGLLVQKGVEPWVVESATHKLFASLQQAHEQLGALRRMLLVVVLCAQHLAPAQIVEWLKAIFYDKAFRLFPALLLHLPPFFAQWPPSFRGCSLTDPSSGPRPTVQTLGPHCQCAAVSAAYQAGALDASRRVSTCLRRGDRDIIIRVPAWVVFGAAKDQIQKEKQWTLAPQDVLPRYQVRTPGDAAPAGLLPFHLSSNMFRKHVRQGTSRCQVPHGVYRVLEEVLQALTQGQTLLMALKEELTNILGNVGTNLGMQSLLQSSATCWDWPRLVSHLPTAAHVEAFLATLHRLRPFFEHTRWPPQDRFPEVQRTWNLSDWEFGKQYLLLLRKVRRVGSLALESETSVRARGLPPLLAEAVSAARSWGAVSGFTVLPCWRFHMVAALMKKLFPKPPTRDKTFHVLVPCLISRFLGIFEGHSGVQELVAQFGVTPESLRLATARFRLRGKSKLPARGVAVSAFTTGALAKVRCAKHLAGRHVIVLARETKVDPSAVSSSIDACRFFSEGTWHAVRVHHRGRLLFAPESACERMGSFMHTIWNGQGALAPGPLIDRVLLKQAHVACTGAPRDEAMIQEIADALTVSMRSTGAHKEPLARIGQAHETLATSGRAYTHVSSEAVSAGRRRELRKMRQAHRDQSLPTSLPDQMTAAVTGAFGSKGRPAAPLPISVDQLHVVQRGATYSVQNNSLIEWLASAQGQAWQKDRARLYAADDQPVTKSNL